MQQFSTWSNIFKIINHYYYNNSKKLPKLFMFYHIVDFVHCSDPTLLVGGFMCPLSGSNLQWIVEHIYMVQYIQLLEYVF